MTVYCTVHVGDFRLGIELPVVREMVRPGPITRVPLAPAGVAGLVHLRGRMLAVIDLKQRLELGPSAPAERRVGVVVEAPAGATVLLADRPGDLWEASAGWLGPAPGKWPAGLVRGAIRQDGSEMLVLDAGRLASP